MFFELLAFGSISTTLKLKNLLWNRAAIWRQGLAANLSSGCIFSRVQPFYERAVRDVYPQRSMHRPVQVADSSFIEGSHTTKNTAFDYSFEVLGCFAKAFSQATLNGLAYIT